MQIFTRFFKIALACLIAIFLNLPNSASASVPTDNENAALTIDVVSLIDVSCFGLETGAVTVLASGGVPVYTYAWSNGTIGPVNLALSAGVYTVTATDLLGATATLDVTIEEPDPLEIDILSQVNIDCNNATGSVTVGSTGGSGLATYVWSDGQIGPIATNLSAGVYIVTGTDENGCIALRTITVEADLTLPTVSATVNAEISCLNASVTLDGSGSSIGNNFIYLWTTVDGHILSGENTLNPVVDEPGTYVLLVTNLLNGCDASESVVVTADIELPDVNATVNAEINCLNATVTLDGSGSSIGNNFIYLWTTVDGHIVSGENTLHPIVDEPGIYVLLVTDLLNGCEASESVVVTANLDLPDVSASVNAEINCLNANVTLDGSGSAIGPNILYLWATVDGHILSGENTLNEAVVDEPGTYVLVVADLLSGCEASDSVVVTANLDLPDVSASVNAEINCLNANVTLDGTGSAIGPNIIYLWATVDGHIVSGENTLNEAVVDEPGTYVLLVVDLLNGCEASDSVVVTADLDLPIVDIDVAAQLGCQNSTVTLDATASTQGNGIIYLWTTIDGNIVSGGNTMTPTVNAAGTYTLTITNSISGCTATGSVVVNGVPSIQVSVEDVVNVDCFGGLNGSASVTVSGGTSPYTYLWSNGMTTSNISGLAAGNYSVTISDDGGCEAVVFIVIAQPDELEATASVTAESSPGMADGSISLTVNGGTSAYTYLWSNGMTTANISGLAAGNYGVTITDAHGCTVVLNPTVPGSSGCALTVDLTAQNTNCGESTGSVTATVGNPTGNVTYLWSNGMTTSSITGLAAGSYSVTVEDGNNCEATATINVGVAADNTPPTAIAQNVEIFLDADGLATLTAAMVNNGSSDLCGNVTVSIDVTDFDCDDIGTQTVTLTVTDQSGNTATATATVTVTDNIAPDFDCPDNIIVTTSGTVDYDMPTYSDNCSSVIGGTPMLIAGLPSGSMFPSGITTVIYAMLTPSGIETCSFTVTVTTTIDVDIDVTPPDCIGMNNGSATVTVTGCTGPFTYLWMDENGVNIGTTATINNLSASTYTVLVANTAGDCSVMQSFVVTDPTPIDIDIVVIENDCEGTGGSIDLTVTGGTPPYTYTWYDENGQIISHDEDLDSIPSGDYHVEVTDAGGCVMTSGILTIDFLNGIIELQTVQGNINVFPNPTSAFSTLNIDLPKESEVSVGIYSLQGALVKPVMDDYVQHSSLQLDLGDLAPGSYLLRTTIDGRPITRKLVRIEE